MLTIKKPSQFHTEKNAVILILAFIFTAMSVWFWITGIFADSDGVMKPSGYWFFIPTCSMSLFLFTYLIKWGFPNADDSADLVPLLDRDLIALNEFARSMNAVSVISEFGAEHKVIMYSHLDELKKKIRTFSVENIRKEFNLTSQSSSTPEARVE